MFNYAVNMLMAPHLARAFQTKLVQEINKPVNLISDVNVVLVNFILSYTINSRDRL